LALLQRLESLLNALGRHGELHNDGADIIPSSKVQHQVTMGWLASGSSSSSSIWGQNLLFMSRRNTASNNIDAALQEPHIGYTNLILGPGHSQRQDLALLVQDIKVDTQIIRQHAGRDDQAIQHAPRLPLLLLVLCAAIA